MSRVPATVFECSVSEFLQRRADADLAEGDAIAAALADKGITQPKKLANLTLEQLQLKSDIPAGYVAIIVEALEQAARFKRALQRNEDGFPDDASDVTSSLSGARFRIGALFVFPPAPTRSIPLHGPFSVSARAQVRVLCFRTS